ncbi:MAG: leucine-rich repeat protein, partial [Candidatus Methanoplasma sp.]|jgi:hypothetical protein|nr:leucine-rich repeat protein [Candidatus Methanoplasma sp.]
LFAAALFLAAAFFVTYTESNESDAAVTGTGTADDPWYCGPNGSNSVTATLIDGVLTISGTDPMDKYAGASDQPWNSEMANIQSVEIEQGVTAIGDRAFHSAGLTSIVIPDSVETIGVGAFMNCTSLTSVIIPDSVATIYGYAFNGCTGLESVTMSNSVTGIGGYVFQKCNKLESIVISDHITTLGDRIFDGCTALKTIAAPSVTFFGQYTFNSSGLTRITVSDAALYSGNNTFNGSKLETVIVVAADGSTASGAIDKYFKAGGTPALSWKLSGASTVAKFLSLPDTSYLDFGPENIAGATGSELHYKDGAFAWDGSEWKDITTYSVSVTVKENGTPVNGARVCLEYIGLEYVTTTGNAGVYILADIPRGATGAITVSKTGYEKGTEQISSLSGDLPVSLDLKINKYEVTLSKGTGISGFAYTVSGSSSDTDQDVSFTVTHGDTLMITAVPSEGYAFDSWSGYSVSSDKTLTISASENISLTASASLIPVSVPPSPSYSIAFSSGSDYTIYANGSSLSSSSPIGVTGGGSLSFSVRTAEGYSAVPVINGIADLITQADSSYVIQNIYSNLSVTVTVSADSRSGQDGDGSGNDPDASPGNSNDSGGDSGEGIPLWIPVILAGAFAVCIGAAAIGHTVLVRRKG